MLSHRDDKGCDIFTYSERVVMTDKKLILNIQLFAESGAIDAGESGTEKFGIRNSEFGMKEDSKSDVLDDEASDCGIENAENGMNEDENSDVLNDEAGTEDDEVVEEEAEEEAEESETYDEKGEDFHEREMRLRNRISMWLNESKGIKELYPDFDLRNELRSSPLFSRLVLSGAPLQAAYEIVHKDEILSGAMAYTADRVREQVVKNIETKGRRPLENGISSESAVMTAIDVNALTAKDIHRILKQVENGASIKF